MGTSRITRRHLSLFHTSQTVPPPLTDSITKVRQSVNPYQFRQFLIKHFSTSRQDCLPVISFHALGMSPFLVHNVRLRSVCFQLATLVQRTETGRMVYSQGDSWQHGSLWCTFCLNSDTKLCSNRSINCRNFEFLSRIYLIFTRHQKCHCIPSHDLDPLSISFSFFRNSFPPSQKMIGPDNK